MTYEQACEREIEAFRLLEEAVNDRSRVNAKAAVFTDHEGPYEERVQRLLAAAQAYEAASAGLLKTRTS